MHLVFESRVVIARSSSSRAPGVFFNFLTRALIAFSHNLLWFRRAFEWVAPFNSNELVVEWVGDIDSPLIDDVLELTAAASPKLDCDAVDDDGDVVVVVVSYGLTLKPSNFLTMAGVMHKFEKWVVSIDILFGGWVVGVGGLVNLMCLFGFYFYFFFSALI